MMMPEYLERCSDTLTEAQNAVERTRGIVDSSRMRMVRSAIWLEEFERHSFAYAKLTRDYRRDIDA